jgi:hypothetical protein
VGPGALEPLEPVKGFVSLLVSHHAHDLVRGVGDTATLIGLGGIEEPLSPRCSRLGSSLAFGLDQKGAKDQARDTIDQEPGAQASP